MSESTEANALLVAGDLYMDRIEDGEHTGYVDVGNATQMALEQSTEFQDLVSRRRETYGQLLASVPQPEPPEINITLDQINRANLAMALLGDSSSYNQEAGTFSDQEVKLKGNNWTPLGLDKTQIKSDGLTIMKDTEELEIGTDIEVHYRTGWIRAMKGSEKVSGGDTVTVSGEYAADSGYRVRGAVRPTIRARLYLDGRNLADDSPIRVTVDMALLTPDSPVDFLSEEFVQLEMTGRMQTLPGNDSPFSVEVPDVSATP